MSDLNFGSKGVVYIARHATPDWSRTDIPYHRVPGPELTEQGLQEAAALGAFLSEAGVVKFYASPLERALRTAMIGAQLCGAPLQVNQALHEVAPADDRTQVRARVLAAWQGAVEESAKIGPIALVTHGGCVMELLRGLGVSESELAHWCKQFDRQNPVPPAGAWRTYWDGDAWRAEIAWSPVSFQPLLAMV